MRKSASSWFTLVIGLLAVWGGRALLVQRQQAELLGVELAAARFDLREREQLRQENARLRSLEIPPAELTALRADHAALPRLRAEFEELSKQRLGIDP